MDDSTVGDVMSDGHNQALKTLAIGAGILTYLGMIAYSGVHNWRLLTAGVAPDMILWAALGVLALELSALALPVALHWWTFSPLQRIAAFAFYGLDLGLIFLNVVLDYAVFTGSDPGALPAWLMAYKFYALPATPVMAGLGWSVLFLLDPSQRERGMIETLRASTREVLARRIAAQARAADIGADVDTAAATLARQIVAETLGVSLARSLPTTTIDGKARDVQPQAASKNGHKPAVVYQATTEDFLAESEQ